MYFIGLTGYDARTNRYKKKLKKTVRRHRAAPENHPPWKAKITANRNL
jgi:hypothetical protein